MRTLPEIQRAMDGIDSLLKHETNRDAIAELEAEKEELTEEMRSVEKGLAEWDEHEKTMNIYMKPLQPFGDEDFDLQGEDDVPSDYDYEEEEEEEEPYKHEEEMIMMKRITRYY